MYSKYMEWQKSIVLHVSLIILLKSHTNKTVLLNNLHADLKRTVSDLVNEKL